MELYNGYAGTEPEKRTVSDQTLRDLLRDKIGKKDVAKGSSTVADVLNIITISVSVAKQGIYVIVFYCIVWIAIEFGTMDYNES